MLAAAAFMCPPPPSGLKISSKSTHETPLRARPISTNRFDCFFPAGQVRTLWVGVVRTRGRGECTRSIKDSEQARQTCRQSRTVALDVETAPDQHVARGELQHVLRYPREPAHVLVAVHHHWGLGWVGLGWT